MVRGRKPDTGEKRDEALCVRFSKTEMRQIDSDRGQKSRSEHLRTRALGK